MIKKLLKWMSRGSSSVTHSTGTAPIEALEDRTFLSAPKVASIFADNRGLVALTVDQRLKAKTVNAKSVRLFTAGPDGKFKTADDVRVDATVSFSAPERTITVHAKLKANTPYRVLLKGERILNRKGEALDGEFRGTGRKSGDGQPGGDYDVVTSPARKLDARFTTIDGIMDVRLFRKEVRTTVKNFVRYANSGLFDRTFFHRATRVGISVVQGGSLGVTNKNTLIDLKDRDPIPLETGISNTRGTIAMARTTDPDSATSGWFFNYQDNIGLDTSGGGYAVFGQVAARDLDVLDALAAYDILNATGDQNIPLTVNGKPVRSALGELPVRDIETVLARQRVDPAQDLIRVTRVALRMDVAATA